MKKLFLYLLFIFAFTAIAKPQDQNNFGVKMGGNLSTFRSVKSEAKFGGTFCIFKDFHIYKSISLAGEFIYSTKKGIIRDKIMGGTFVGPVYLRDIYYSLGVVEFPILAKIHHHFINSKLKLSYFFGPSFSTRLFYMSETKKTRFLFEVNDIKEWDNINYDYESVYEVSPTFEHGWSIHSGITLHYSPFLVEIRYIYDQYAIKTVSTAVINEKLHSWMFLLGFNF